MKSFKSGTCWLSWDSKEMRAHGFPVRGEDPHCAYTDNRLLVCIHGWPLSPLLTCNAPCGLSLHTGPCDSPHVATPHSESAAPREHSGRCWEAGLSLPLRQRAQRWGCREGRAPASPCLTGCWAGRLSLSCHFRSQKNVPEIQISA